MNTAQNAWHSFFSLFFAVVLAANIGIWFAKQQGALPVNEPDSSQAQAPVPLSADQQRVAVLEQQQRIAECQRRYDYLYHDDPSRHGDWAYELRWSQAAVDDIARRAAEIKSHASETGIGLPRQ
jgi:hypothetical protein